MAFVVKKGKDNLRCCSRSPAPASLKILFRGLLWSFLLFHTFLLSSSYGSQDSSSGLSFAVFHHFSFRFFFQLHRLIVLISIQFFHLLMTLSLSILGFMFLLFLLSSVPRSLFFLCCYSLEWFLFCFCFLQNSTFFLILWTLWSFCCSCAGLGADPRLDGSRSALETINHLYCHAFKFCRLCDI